MSLVPLVLLPGMMCDARLFTHQIAVLSNSCPIHLAPINGHYSVQALAAEILEHAPPRFALAGLSMGGIVAMELIAQAPGRIDRLALMDTNPLAEQDKIKNLRDSLIKRVRDGSLRQVMQEELKPRYLTSGPYLNQILALCLEMALDQGEDVFVRQSRALQNRPDQQDTLRRVQVPTLVLCGEDDQLCPLERHQLMHDLIAGSKLKIIKAAGHLSTLEQPEAVAQALMDWLSM